MRDSLFKWLRKISLWHFIWVSVLLSEIFTTIMSYFLTGRVSREFIITGAVVPVFVATFVIALVREMRKDSQRILILSTALDESPVMAVVADREEKVIYANKSFMETTGYNGRELLGKDLGSLCSNAMEGGMYRQMMDTVASGRVWKDELLCTRVDGGTFWQRLHMTALRDHKGEATHYVSLMEDITRHKQDEKALKDSRHMLRLVLDTIPVRVFWKDTALRYMGCNRLFSMDAGLGNPETIVGKDDFTMPWTEEAESYREDDRMVMDSGRAKVGFEEKQTSPEGKTLWLRTSKVPLKDDSGNLLGVMGTYEDITDKKLMEEDLRVKESAIESSLSGIVISSLQGRITYANRSFIEMWGYGEASEVIGMSPDVLAHDKAEAHRITGEIMSSGSWSGDMVARKRDGALFNVHLSASMVLDAQGSPLCLMSSFVDVSEKTALEKKLRTLSVTDELTGLLNRRGFNMLADKQLSSAQREDRDIYILFADLDGLKDINDSYGHTAGDLALTLMAEAIKSTFRESDITGRVGGDEFAVLMISSDDAEDEGSSIERLDSAVNKVNERSMIDFQLSISSGISKAPARDIENIEKLMSIADKRMYRKKLTKKRNMDSPKEN